MYATPVVAVGNGDAVVIVSVLVAGFTVSAKTRDCVLCDGAQESVTCTLGLKEPLTVGVPESKPLVTRLMPDGREPPISDHE